MTVQPQSRRLDKFVLRMPDGMREEIADAARQNNRSMNAEIVSRLEESFRDEERSKAAAARLLRMGPGGDDPAQARINDHETRIRDIERWMRSRKS